jgi:hypothetical protein
MPSLRELLGFGKSEGANNLVILNGYPLAVVVAISLHILLLGGLVYLQSSSQSQALELIQPTVIKALLIEENPQITNQRNQDNRRLEAKRKETERANAAAQKKREEQAAERSGKRRQRRSASSSKSQNSAPTPKLKQNAKKRWQKKSVRSEKPKVSERPRKGAKSRLSASVNLGNKESARTRKTRLLPRQQAVSSN